jgi:membrane protein involved in colicin uptake
MHLYLYNKEEDNMIKNKGLMVMFLIIVIVVTFFTGIAFAERVARDNKGEGYVFIGGSVTEIIVSESVIEENRKLIGWERKKREPIETKLRRLMNEEERLNKKQEVIQDDYIKRRQEQERIKEEEQEEEQEKMQEQERRQEQERIKKEDWFR